MQGIITFIIVFFVLVTVHELGHFLIAKRSGILCQEFAIGMGPKIFHKKIGETNFTIRLIPIGGYVKMPDNVFDFNNDVSPYDLKKGMRVNLKLDSNDRVEKIILDNTTDMDLLPMELNEFDLVNLLYIEGFVGDELQKFEVSRDACVVFSGMEEQIAPLDRMFSSHSWGKKFWTLFAGPLMNFVLAILIFVGMAIYTGVPSDSNKVGAVAKDMPAISAGLKAGDTITEVNGTKINSWIEIGENVSKSEGKEVSLKILRDNKEEVIKITPKTETVTSRGQEVKSYKLGIMRDTEHNFVDSIKYGLQQTLYWGTQVFMGIITLFASIFNGGFSLNQLGGPVAIYEMSSQVSKSGLLDTLRLMGILSVNLGLMNLIPIPVLDGGRIVFVLYEAIFGKPINKKAEYYATAIFGILLVALMVAVTWNDIQRLFGR